MASALSETSFDVSMQPNDRKFRLIHRYKGVDPVDRCAKIFLFRLNWFAFFVFGKTCVAETQVGRSFLPFVILRHLLAALDSFRHIPLGKSNFITELSSSSRNRWDRVS